MPSSLFFLSYLHPNSYSCTSSFSSQSRTLHALDSGSLAEHANAAGPRTRPNWLSATTLLCNTDRLPPIFSKQTGNSDGHSPSKQSPSRVAHMPRQLCTLRAIVAQNLHTACTIKARPVVFLNQKVLLWSNQSACLKLSHRLLQSVVPR